MSESLYAEGTKALNYRVPPRSYRRQWGKGRLGEAVAAWMVNIGLLTYSELEERWWLLHAYAIADLQRAKIDA